MKAVKWNGVEWSRNMGRLHGNSCELLRCGVEEVIGLGWRGLALGGDCGDRGD